MGAELFADLPPDERRQQLDVMVRGLSIIFLILFFTTIFIY